MKKTLEMLWEGRCCVDKILVDYSVIFVNEQPVETSANTFKFLSGDIPLRRFRLILTERNGRDVSDDWWDVEIVKNLYPNDLYSNTFSVLAIHDSNYATDIRTHPGNTYDFCVRNRATGESQGWTGDMPDDVRMYLILGLYVTDYVFRKILSHRTTYETTDEVKICSTIGRRIAKQNPGKRVVEITKGLTIVHRHNREGEKRRYEIRTGEFTVRGHYRHYKNGKTVFVQPYRKRIGKMPSDKTYIVG